jgi:hypothetical protein
MDVPDPLEPPALSERKKSDESYNVYSAILREFGTKSILIEENTGTGLFNATVESDGTGLTGEIIASYNLENESSTTLENRFSGPGDYVLINDYENPSQAFSKKYPDPEKRFAVIARFSKVGFDQEMKRAIVRASYRCGALCGSGDFYFLVKTEKGWQVEWKENLWVS